MSRQLKDRIEQAKREPSRENIVEMWRHIFLLKAWYFLPSKIEEGPDTPKLLDLDTETTLPVFLNIRRLRDFWEHTNSGEPNDIPMLPLDPLESIRQIREHKSIIEYVSFNPTTSSSIKVPTQALIEYADYFNLPLESTK